MLPLLAMMPPPPVETRVLFCLIGAAFGAVLARWLRGGFSLTRATVVLPLAILLLVGLDLIGGRGDLAFLVGLVAGGFTAFPRSSPRINRRGAKSLAALALIAGPVLGAALFAILWWHEGREWEVSDFVYSLAILLAFGTWTGLLVAALTVWLGDILTRDGAPVDQSVGRPSGETKSPS